MLDHQALKRSGAHALDADRLDTKREPRRRQRSERYTPSDATQQARESHLVKLRARSSGPQGERPSGRARRLDERIVPHQEKLGGGSGLRPNDIVLKQKKGALGSPVHATGADRCGWDFPSQLPQPISAGPRSRSPGSAPGSTLPRASPAPPRRQRRCRRPYSTPLESLRGSSGRSADSRHHLNSRSRLE